MCRNHSPVEGRPFGVGRFRRCRMGAVLALFVALGLSPLDRARADELSSIPAGSEPDSAGASSPSWGKRLLFYVPNRIMDFADIFRARIRLGPGLAVNLRMTDYGGFYVGNYNTVYVGLPGPRAPHRLRLPVGRESLTGIVLAGVDATDDTPHGPEYGAAEADLGVQLLVVGAEAGVDAVEFIDFLAGLVFRDPRDDDFPRAAPVLPKTTSAISMGAGEGVFQVDPKPDTFGSTAQRLDYLHENVQRRVSEPLRASDAYFAMDPEAPIPIPETQFRLGLYASMRESEGFELKLSPNLEIDVELPNLKQKLRVFVESARANDLPQNQLSDKENQGINVGARKFYERMNLSFDAGVRAKWLPEAFGRVSWKRQWNCGRLDITPEARVFYETEDKEGALASLFVNRWLGDSNEGILIQDASVKWRASKDTLEWGTSLSAARVVTMLDENQRGHHMGWEDTARSQGVKYTVYGSYGNVDAHRLGVGFRAPLYKRWIYWDFVPGLEWKREEDYTTAIVIQVGIDMLFWGQAYQ